jgi:hypothetical protein
VTFGNESYELNLKKPDYKSSTIKYSGNKCQERRGFLLGPAHIVPRQGKGDWNAIYASGDRTAERLTININQYHGSTIIHLSPELRLVVAPFCKNWLELTQRFVLWFSGHNVPSAKVRVLIRNFPAFKKLTARGREICDALLQGWQIAARGPHAAR